MAQKFQAPDFKKIADLLIAALPVEVAEIAKEFFRSSFDKEGFTDYGFIAWPRGMDTIGKLMDKSGALKNSIEIVTANKDIVRIEAGRGIPYAEIHNTGGIIRVRVTDKMRKFFWYMYKRTESAKWKWMALTKKEVLNITIPQRQYIGQSEVLLKDIDQHIINRIIKTFKSVTDAKL